MKERIDRKTDEDLYQPKIHSRRIRELYALKVITGLPMTVLVDLAIKELVEKCGVELKTIHNQDEPGARTTKGND